MAKPTVDLEKYDIRVINRYLRNGTIDQATYDAWIAGLPDESELGVDTEAQFASSSQGDANQSENVEA